MKRTDVINENHYCGDVIAVERLLSILPDFVSEDVSKLLAVPEGGCGPTFESAKESLSSNKSLVKKIQDKTYKTLVDTRNISIAGLIIGSLGLLTSIVSIVW